ncbi:IclR family transcriptional regulator [Pigmentiphaga sp. H8]|uniref:IclR family transcriptional regulator n=1 Tax=unclassified Pigmentiphaga TaxID=2626614 RepID=UPI000F59F8D5|nr:IclR family transcriptional regulator [Pigmentiphaga sp. H8]AZG09741.1 IclR family transcriptional regulator [Pigmentiphaga sp. H8]
MTTAPADSSTDDRPRVEAVERSLLLLKCFEKPGEALSLAVLAQRSGLYKSTILRLASSLIHMGFLQRDAMGVFRLGPELRRLGALSHSQVDLAPLMRPVLLKLSAQTQETVSFYVRDGDERICRYRVNSPRSARHHLEEGTRHPLSSGAAGKILRAFGGEPMDDAEAIRTQGWTASCGERDPDLAAVAVPVRNAQGELLGALAVSGLIYRFTPEQIELARRALQEAVRALEPRLPPLEMTDLTDQG